MRTRRFTILFFVLTIVIISFYDYTVEKKFAIIIDPLEIDSEFKTKSMELLTKNGFQVRYISGEDVTVEFFKNLPKGNDLYILRVHSTCINNRTWIFTGEKYNSETYPILQLTDLIHRAKPSLESAYYFSVSPELIQQYNKESLTNGVILMMGCEGLYSEDPAKAFCLSGATVYISWDGYVCLEHTDLAFLTLIEALCTRKLSVSDSLTYINTLIGDDPIYSSSLKHYPPEHGYLKVS